AEDAAGLVEQADPGGMGAAECERRLREGLQEGVRAGSLGGVRQRLHQAGEGLALALIIGGARRTTCQLDGADDLVQRDAGKLRNGCLRRTSRSLLLSRGVRWQYPLRGGEGA